MTVPATAASADSHCRPASGADTNPSISQIQTRESAPDWAEEVEARRLDPYAEDAHDVVLSGGGWGHGVGMSQYGAQGAAKDYGCTAGEILGTYFPNTVIEGRPSPAELRLKLWTTGTSGVTSVWAEERTRWRRCDADGSNCSLIFFQPADTTAKVTVEGSGFRIRGNGFDETVEDRIESVVEVRHDGKLIRVQQGTGDVASTGRPIRYGTLEFDFADFRAGARLFTTEVIEGGGAAELSAMETYLLGLAEVPLSWEMEALRAQVIAARSYAMARIQERRSLDDLTRVDRYDCRCDLVVTTGDQVWKGEEPVLDAPTYFPRWEQAVTGTAGSYVVRNGEVLATFYSSSHGGVSRRGFDSTSSNYSSVDASAWEKSSGNPFYRWSKGFSRAQLQSAFGMDDIDEIEVVAKDGAGYPLPDGFVVRGVDNGQQVEWTYSADAVRSRLGLRSPRFVVHEITDLADDSSITTARLSGPTRAETAIRLSADGWSEGSEMVVLAREDNPADALTGSALAGTHDAPLLLTRPDRLADEVRVELQRLGADRVYLLGGEAALSNQVVTDLRAAGITHITRVKGDTRHGTAREVAERVDRGSQSTAYLVRLRDTQVEARGWADALSVSAVAARRASDGTGWPILGTEASLPAETRQAIQDLGITRIVPVGGSAVIPDRVLRQLENLGVQVAGRLAGQDRYGTSRAVTATDTPTSQSLVIATGQNYPDGLAAGPYAARTGGALLLVPTGFDPAGSPWQAGQHPAAISSFGWTDPSLVAVGGEVAIQTPVIRHVANLLEDAAR